MSIDSFSTTAHRPLTAAMIGFAAVYALHAIDHLRRGMAASPPSIMVGGTKEIIVLIAVVLVVRHHPRACEAAIAVGFGSAARQRHLVLVGYRGRRDRRGPGARVRGSAGATALGRELA